MDVALALGVVILLSILVLPLPAMVLDLGLALSITAAVLVLMVALFLDRPPRLHLVPHTPAPHDPAPPRAERRYDAAHPVARCRRSRRCRSRRAGVSQLVLGSNGIVIGVIIFCILLVVKLPLVITKGSGRIAEVAARFTLDSMPGKQMAIDAELCSGLIDDKAARKRRRELEAEDSFFGAMDGAAKFVRGDAIASLIITCINIIGGLTIGVAQHGLGFSDAIQRTPR